MPARVAAVKRIAACTTSVPTMTFSTNARWMDSDPAPPFDDVWFWRICRYAAMSSVPVPHAGSTTRISPNSPASVQSMCGHLSGESANPAKRIDVGIRV